MASRFLYWVARVMGMVTNVSLMTFVICTTTSSIERIDWLCTGSALALPHRVVHVSRPSREKLCSGEGRSFFSRRQVATAQTLPRQVACRPKI